jgi:hypothetical protein
VVPVTGGARRRAEISTDNECVVVHARAVLYELVRGDRVAVHVRGICVATRACLGNVQWMNCRAGVTGRPEAMQGRSSSVSLGDTPPGRCDAGCEGGLAPRGGRRPISGPSVNCGNYSRRPGSGLPRAEGACTTRPSAWRRVSWASTIRRFLSWGSSVLRFLRSAARTVDQARGMKLM